MTSSMGSIRPVIAPKAMESMSFASPIGIQVVVPRSTSSRAFVLRASMVNSYENSSNFVQRMEKAWLISQVYCVRFFLRCFPILIDDKIGNWPFFSNFGLLNCFISVL